MKRLSPEEIALLKQAAHSAYQSTREKYPNIRFAKHDGGNGVLPASRISSLQEEARQAFLKMGMIDSPDGGMMSPPKKQPPLLHRRQGHNLKF